MCETDFSGYPIAATTTIQATAKSLVAWAWRREGGGFHTPLMFHRQGGYLGRLGKALGRLARWWT